MADNVLRFPTRTAGADPAAVRPPVPGREPEPLWREAVGDELRDRRADRDERIVDVAARAGVSPQYLSELERGRKDPSSEVLAAVSGALGLSVTELTRRASLRLARDVVRGQAQGPARGPVCLAA